MATKTAFTTKDAEAVSKALAKLEERAWVVGLFGGDAGLAVELSGARWQITDPTAKADDIAVAAADWLLAHQPKAL